MGVVLGNFMRPCGTEAGKCEFSSRPWRPQTKLLPHKFVFLQLIASPAKRGSR